MDMTNEEYKKYVQGMAKPSPSRKNLVWAFCVGGGICTVGQILSALYQRLGLDRTDAGTAVSVTLIFVSALCTGLGIFDDLAKHAGAGTLVPITGFANAMVAPALEFKSDVRCIIRIVRENRDKRVSGLNPTKFIGKEVLEAAIIPHEFRLPRSQMGVADPSGSPFPEYYTHRRSYHATRSIVP